MLKKKRLKNRNKYNKHKSKKIKAIKFFSKNLKNHSSLLKLKYHKIIRARLKPLNYYIIIRVTPNNIFCVLKSIKQNKTVVLMSAGILDIKISKKGLKYAGKILITSFVDKIRKRTKNALCYINISAPIKTRKFALKKILSSLKKTKMLIHTPDKKIFNGCRAKKKRRKKRKGLRVLK